MHGERPEFVPSEADQQINPEIKNNVIEFPRKEKPAEHAVEHILKEGGAHESHVSLTESDLSEAENELSTLKKHKAEILLNLNKNIKVMGFGKKSARDYNAAMSPKNLESINAKIKKLEGDIALTKASHHVENQELGKAA